MSEKKLIDISSGIKNKFLRGLYGFVKWPVEHFFGFAKLNIMYEVLQRLSADENFFYAMDHAFFLQSRQSCFNSHLTLMHLLCH